MSEYAFRSQKQGLQAFLLIVCDTWNKQLNPTYCQPVPLYMILMKISFPHRGTGKKMLDKISRYPQLAAGKGSTSQRQLGGGGVGKKIVPQDMPGTNEGRCPRKSGMGQEESSCCRSCWHMQYWPIAGAVTSPSCQDFDRGRESRATLLLDS